MIVEDQSECLAFLRDPATTGAPPATIAVVETHIAIVVLAGDRAFKLKRAVRLPYLDFSTAERRLAVCERELALNRRTAPGLYRAVRRVTRTAAGGLAFDGDGPLVDAVVEMARFDGRDLFDRMAAEGRLTAGLLDRLAAAVARFHDDAEVRAGGDGAARMAAVLDINERAFAATRLFPAADLARFEARFRDALAGLAPLLDRRAAAGRVRHCHGDLHLRNICLLDGEPTLFDCLEFDEEMATTDVLYDLAFLTMDLWHRGLEAPANRVLNRYLDARDEADGLPAMPFFMGVRAAVRAHVAATRHADGGDAAAASEARAYFDLAEALLEPAPPRLVAVGGLSGSGKSTVAAGIAPGLGAAPGARVLSSDRIRKAMFAVAPETRLPAEAYRPEVSQEIYRRLGEEAVRVLRLGHAVVADAVFDRAEARAGIAAIAAVAGVPFSGLWLDVPAERLIARVEARKGDPSDADRAVVEAQLARMSEPVPWTRIEAGGTAATALAGARRALER